MTTTNTRPISTIQPPRYFTQYDHPCQKCGYVPTKLVMRGPIMTERHCFYCGSIRFLENATSTA